MDMSSKVPLLVDPHKKRWTRRRKIETSSASFVATLVNIINLVPICCSSSCKNNNLVPIEGELEHLYLCLYLYLYLFTIYICIPILIFICCYSCKDNNLAPIERELE